MCKRRVMAVVLALVWVMLAGCGTDKQISEAAPAEAQPAAEVQTAAPEVQEPEPKVQPEVQAEEPEEDYSWLYEEINPDIPLGSTYELGQGAFTVGEDIPAGRYRIEWVSGNQFGGSLKASSDTMFMDMFCDVGPGESYTCLLYDDDEFEISLATMRFTKVASVPNEDYLQPDGSYIFGPGYYFEGIDIPCGKYNVTALSGNQFGITLHTNNNYIDLDIGETYNNLKLQDMTYAIDVSLGTVQFRPR